MNSIIFTRANLYLQVKIIKIIFFRINKRYKS